MKKPVFLPEISDENWRLWLEHKWSITIGSFIVEFRDKDVLMMHDPEVSNRYGLALYSPILDHQALSDWLWMVKYQPKTMKRLLFKNLGAYVIFGDRARPGLYI